ncbi:AraC family transcriptional regulator [Paenibacillus filicis]|uniref:AraC family transcriptional regulator n=1 Tax=Paenibacillus filicis TaxID=669464 RepID=A0ABU9DNG7_9BACL
MQSVRLISHKYWHRKHQFALEHDIYTYWTMFVPEEGSFGFRIGEHAGEAGVGDVVICPPQVRFHRQVVEPVSFHFLHLELETGRQEVEAREGDMEDAGIPSFWSFGLGGMAQRITSLAGCWTFQDKQRLASTCRLLHEQAAGFGQTRDLLKTHAVNDLWLWTLLERMPQSPELPNASLPSSGDSVMDRARAYILEHACEELNLRGLAGQLQVTPVQLTRRFRAAFAVTPMDFVTELRLSRTCRLLEETSLSLEQIAPQCGYENGYYLSRIFTRKKGMTPSAYRRLHRV